MGDVDAVGLGRDGESQRPLVGQLIKGKYSLTHKLASGSLGTAYLGEDRSTGTRLFVKIFRPEFAKDDDLVRKLRRQMQAVAAVSEQHATIARVYDCDLAEDGSLFIAMEQLPRRTLRDVMREAGALEIGRALSLAGQMAAGLNAAHVAGIVHTDVHPQNFMVVGKEEAIKIVGFERARFRNVGAMDHLVPPSGISRTPEYLAPEQIRKGRREDISSQTDIYAFGVVLYEMLTGAVPFQASTPDEVLAKHLHMLPTAPKTLRPEIPVEVEAKVLQALEKEAKWRENTATEVVSELLRDFPPGRLRASEAPISRRGTVHQARGDKVRLIVERRRRARARWTLALIGVALIVIAAAGFWWFYPPRTPEVAHEPPTVPRREEPPALAPTPVGGTQTDVAEKPPPPPEVQPPPEPVVTKSAPSVPTAKPPKPVDTKPTRKAPTPAPPSRAAPDTKSSSPDPSEIIDWLLKKD